MKRHIVKIFAVMAAVMFMSITVLELSTQARVGGGRSFGSRGSRSYSRPVTPAPQQRQPRQQYAPVPGPIQQQGGGGFMRGMAGGLWGACWEACCSAAMPERAAEPLADPAPASACLVSFSWREDATSFTGLSRKEGQTVRLPQATSSERSDAEMPPKIMGSASVAWPEE